jgi:hypothetical protein
MAQNPFPTRAKWKEEKAKYGIPDKVIKSGSFGEKMDALSKKFQTSGLSKVDASNVQVARTLVKQGNALLDEWLNAAGKLQPTAFKGAAGNKAKAIACVKQYKDFVAVLENQADVVKDPFINARKNYQACHKLMTAAMAHPDDPKALSNFYSQGMRNHLGAPFRAALKIYTGNTELVQLLNSYDALVGKWNTIQTQGAAGVAADADRRKEFMEDMQEAMKLGVRILRITQ